MNYNQSELKEMWMSLNAMSKNKDLENIPIFRNGNKLLPRYKEGSGIHIKKKNRGKFTKSAKASGQSVQEHAQSVLSNPNATPLQKKRANFARNAKAWSKK